MIEDKVQIIPLDVLGLIAVMILQRMQNSKLKRERKRAFLEIQKLIQLSRIIPSGVEYTHIGEGVDSLGNPVVIVRFLLGEQK